MGVFMELRSKAPITWTLSNMVGTLTGKTLPTAAGRVSGFVAFMTTETPALGVNAMMTPSLNGACLPAAARDVRWTGREADFHNLTSKPGQS